MNSIHNVDISVLDRTNCWKKKNSNLAVYWYEGSHKLDTLLNCFDGSGLMAAPWWTHDEIRWWAMAKGPGMNIGASSPLSTLKSEEKFWPFSTPLHICLTLKAAVHWAFSYSANVSAFWMSSLLCHWASTQTSRPTSKLWTHPNDRSQMSTCKYYQAYQRVASYQGYMLSSQLQSVRRTVKKYGA